MRTANPALNSKTFQGFDAIPTETEAMTLRGTVNKIIILLFLLVVSAAFVWMKHSETKDLSVIVPYIILGGVGGFITALVTVFKKNWAIVTAPLYAILEGLIIGGLSALFDLQYPGIVLQAVALTFGTCAMLLVAYSTGWIKPSENFKLGVFAATGAIALIYLVTFILSIVGISFPSIHGNGIIGIAFSGFVVAIAALNLVLDFDFIEQGAEQGAPKFMEWYAAFGLMVTLIWLYIEILRLLAKLRSRN
jgi:uncharacterized YccA/Bax inhibitor family protein